MDSSLSRRAYETGLIGTAVALLWFAAYALFGKIQLPGGGPLVPNFVRALPVHSEHRLIARDFFDVIGILVLVYVVMAGWDGIANKRYRWGGLALAALGLVLAWATALGVVPWEPSSLIAVGRLQVTTMELVIAGSAMSGLVAPALYLLRHERRLIRRANLRPGLYRGWVRWLTGYLTLCFVSLVFLTHPFFRSALYGNGRLAFNWLLVLHVVIGLPYSLLTNWLRYDLNEDRKDPCFGLLLFYRRAFLAVRERQWRPLRQVVCKPWVRSNLLDLFCVKFFFTPIMLSFVFSEGGRYFVAVGNLYDWVTGAGHGWHTVSYQALLRTVLLTDVVIGVIGYAGTSRWLGNKSRSVDPTMSGWLWALLCYPPFNCSSSQLLPFHSEFGGPLFSSPWLANFCAGVMVVCFAIYAWATVAFGLRFSNMTHRGIVYHGPYAYVRHPAYVAKGIAWLAELLPKLGNYWQLLGLFGFLGIYLMRGLTEERHLSQDPEYREYCSRVPWRFVPGLF